MLDSARGPALRAGLLILLAICCVRGVAVAAIAGELQRFKLPGGQEIEVTRFAGDGTTNLLWIPSERGFDAAQAEHAANLARLGHTVWLADLHGSYFVQAGRNSIGKFPLDDIVDLVEVIAAQSPRRLFLLSSGRGAQLALIAAREWQLRNPGDESVAGLFLSHAYLYGARPAPGADADYLPVVSATNLPVYLLAAEYSTKASRLEELAEALEQGGSTVYRHRLAGVRGGFASRSETAGSAEDWAARRAYPATVSRAIGLLALHRPPGQAYATALDTRRIGAVGSAGQGLKPVDNGFVTPALALDAIDGTGFSLQQHRGQVLLVNFWASWCRPCVVEIPSLHRLRDELAGADFRIVTVNVGESRQHINRFMEQVPVELPVLMDYDSTVSRDWKIYVYPSSYLLDRQGQIRYAYLGALEWDSMENVRIIRDLLKQP